VPYAWIVALVTAVAFVLRLTGMHQVLFGDELFTYPIVTRASLWDALSAVHHTSVTPPFHYVLAWLAVQLGDPLVTIRLPSLILGTATVPVVYLLGARAAGRPAGLLAAALVAISPFAIFYGTEGRAYATLTFLAAVSTLALLRALDDGRGRWWALFAAASCLALYTHYTGVFLVLAQLAWAWWAHAERRRAVVASAAAIAVGFLPWFPFFLDQRENKGIEVLASFADLTLGGVGRAFARFFPGHPFHPVADLPGRPEAFAVALVLLLALAAAVAWQWRKGRPGLPARSDPLTLIMIGTLATPVGVLLWSLGGDSILLARTLSASLPAFAVLVGAGITRLPRPWAAIAAAVLLGAVAVGTVQTQTTDFRNSAFRDAAEYVNREGGSGDSVVQISLAAPGTPLANGFSLYLDRDIPLYGVGGDEAAAWRRAADGGRVFFVYPQLEAFGPTQRRAGPGKRFVLRSHKVFDDLTPVVVNTYTAPGR
jgi:4-amino-4-deoxy-L-arabinose transferase-like glycosyltransferase